MLNIPKCECVSVWGGWTSAAVIMFNSVLITICRRNNSKLQAAEKQTESELRVCLLWKATVSVYNQRLVLQVVNVFTGLCSRYKVATLTLDIVFGIRNGVRPYDGESRPSSFPSSSFSFFLRWCLCPRWRCRRLLSLPRGTWTPTYTALWPEGRRK